MSNCTIGSLCKRFSAGSGISSKQINKSGPYPVYGANGIRGYTDSYNFDGKCAIIGRQGAECGNVHYFEGRAFMTEHAIVAEPNENNVAGYLAYKLSLMNLGRYQGQSAQPGLSANTLSSLEISVPSLEAQQKIFDYLKFFDSKIANNNAISKELESMAKTIYDYWFLQFEFPDKDGKPYKSNGGKMVWNDQLKQEIPEGWEVKGILDCADVQYGKPLSTKLFSEKGTPVIRIRDINTLSNSAYTEENVEDKYLSKTGDLLIGMDGNFQMNFWPRNNDCVNQRIVRIRKKSFPSLLIKFQIKPYIDQKVSSVARSTVGHLKANDIKELKILIPATGQLDLSIFDTFLQKMLTINQENKQLQSLRDFLLPLLMNGQVTVED